MSKTEIRKKYKQQRAQLSSTRLSELSNRICQHLKTAVNWKEIENLQVYQAIGGLNEINPAEFINWLKSEHSQIKIFVQPNAPIIDEKKQFDCIIVPCLVVDTNKHRLGYGGGFYDSFLAKQSKALKIGLISDSSIVKQIPAEDHDIPMDLIVTQSRII